MAKMGKEEWQQLEKAFEDSVLTRRVGLLSTLLTMRLENSQKSPLLQQLERKINVSVKGLNGEGGPFDAGVAILRIGSAKLLNRMFCPTGYFVQREVSLLAGKVSSQALIGERRTDMLRVWSRAKEQRWEETRDPRGKSPTSSIVTARFPYAKIRGRNRTRFAFMGALGATVAERLAYSPPTKSIRAQSPSGSLRIFASGNRAVRGRWSAGFLWDLPFPPPFHSGCSIPQSHSSALSGPNMSYAMKKSLQVYEKEREMRALMRAVLGNKIRRCTATQEGKVIGENERSRKKHVGIANFLIVKATDTGEGRVEGKDAASDLAQTRILLCLDVFQLLRVGWARCSTRLVGTRVSYVRYFGCGKIPADRPTLTATLRIDLRLACRRLRSAVNVLQRNQWHAPTPTRETHSKALSLLAAASVCGPRPRSLEALQSQVRLVAPRRFNCRRLLVGLPAGSFPRNLVWPGGGGVLPLHLQCGSDDHELRINRLLFSFYYKRPRGAHLDGRASRERLRKLVVTDRTVGGRPIESETPLKSRQLRRRTDKCDEKENTLLGDASAGVGKKYRFLFELLSRLRALAMKTRKRPAPLDGGEPCQETEQAPAREHISWRDGQHRQLAGPLPRLPEALRAYLLVPPVPMNSRVYQVDTEPEGETGPITESVSEDIWAALDIKVLRADKDEESTAGMKGTEKRDVPEKTCRPAASSGTIPTCENPGAAQPEIEHALRTPEPTARYSERLTQLPSTTDVTLTAGLINNSSPPPPCVEYARRGVSVHEGSIISERARETLSTSIGDLLCFLLARAAGKANPEIGVNRLPWTTTSLQSELVGDRQQWRPLALLGRALLHSGRVLDFPSNAMD
ncbi:hypothetical protein PR048_001592 [Dryococelus australis]|uniref:Uncharacterized protein n=1 Tax=Dryococelus australis TaxID=614101 RepID=A0ABQ9IHY8_9NEOP|nr:hypothetical protein PR048_001592 [Dryococelus australis]